MARRRIAVGSGESPGARHVGAAETGFRSLVRTTAVGTPPPGASSTDTGWVARRIRKLCTEQSIDQIGIVKAAIHLWIRVAGPTDLETVRPLVGLFGSPDLPCGHV